MTSTAQPFGFSIAKVAPSNRVHALLALRERGLFPIEPLPNRMVHVDLFKWSLPDLNILSGTFAGIRHNNAAQLAEGELLLGLNLRGETTLVHCGRELTARRGDAFIANASPGSLNVFRPLTTQFIGLRIPQTVLAPLIRDMAEGVRLIPGDSPTVKLLIAYARALVCGNALALPETQRLFAAHLHDLVALAVGPRRDGAAGAELRSLPAVRLRAIKSDIVARLTDER